VNGWRLWLRAETRPTEHRAPVVPADAARLVEHGIAVTVEDSPRRVFGLAEYVAAGCVPAAAGSWPDAPPDTVVLGLKELPDQPAALVHRHVYFPHAFKGQPGAAALLARAVAGGGVLLDLEELADPAGRRLAAFGRWAGYVGAALAVLRYRGRLGPLRAGPRADLDKALTAGGPVPRALVIGALGRGGRGAQEALAVAGAPATCWDLAETRDLDRAALLDHDILVNAVLTSEPGRPFLTGADLDDPARRLTVVCDVTCDVNSPLNAVPIYTELTDWDEPARRLRTDPPLDLIAIDNLPALLPREASVAFSADLTPQLLAGLDAPAWRRCAAAFEAAVRASGLAPADA
jgi:saccharopine dehydrogenase (NAD+, L-lysine forming)